MTRRLRCVEDAGGRVGRFGRRTLPAGLPNSNYVRASRSFKYPIATSRAQVVQVSDPVPLNCEYRAKKVGVACAFFLLLLTGRDLAAQSQTTHPPTAPSHLLSIGVADSLYSTTLQEERLFWIHLPDGGLIEGLRYPVIYLLDMLAFMSLEAGQPDKARAILALSAESYPENPSTHTSLMEVCLSLEDYSCAETHALSADRIEGGNEHAETVRISRQSR